MTLNSVPDGAVTGRREWVTFVHNIVCRTACRLTSLHHRHSPVSSSNWKLRLRL